LLVCGCWKNTQKNQNKEERSPGPYQAEAGHSSHLCSAPQRTAGEWWCSFTPQFGPSRRQAGENCWWDSHWADACSPDHGGTISEGQGDTGRPCAISRARRVTWSGRAGGSLGSAVCPLLVKKNSTGCEREAASPSYRFGASANPRDQRICCQELFDCHLR